MHISLSLFKLRVTTKVKNWSKRSNQAKYFYRTSISRTTTHSLQYWNLIHIKYPIINFFYSIMKLSFPVSTFNTHTYFFAISEKLLHKNMQKTLRTTQNLFNIWGKSSQAVRKQFFFLCEVVASKVWCYIRTTITCKNRHHVLCSLAHGG